ncbi:ABC transporter, substrate binding protein (oligopeptide) [Ketogulonicigenium robustum]|uniref:ABC transporter, substrate binding protein (Oligopeptide) n=1 Tax=Ketogulonicigenium robustum TaxID=92947 RepID=A0A1W6NWJ8_9RHOB|nr:ABC transporter substrate-binding protein [Ketogulonicigenium robustum]ARO13407.1 ABC transporter, substrate binding protein (oligopeptide) [Ketogulonicigenium robustum]
MKAPSFTLGRRAFIASLAASTALPMASLPSRLLAQEAKAGGMLRTVAWPAPTVLNSAISTAGTESFIAPKMFDGLLAYDTGLVPRGQLAESWDIAEDGLTVTFKLRDGVKWHDGTAFTAKDVAFTFMEVLKVIHGRGKATFAALEAVDTPDDLTAVFRLTTPSPAMMRALDSRESPILPAHIYEGTDIQANPANTAPIGTGPFKMAEYEVGSYIVLVKNPDYWDAGLPLLDRIIIQFVADAATRASMLEAGQIDGVFLNMLPAPEILRLDALPDFERDTKGYEAMPSAQQLDFNLDNEYLADIRVRHAIAHAIDTDWITQNIWYGLGAPGKSPLHVDQKEYYTTDGVPSYDYDLEKAKALLDEAGFAPAANGMRFSLMLDPSPWGTESIGAAPYIKEQLRQIGIDVTIRTQDFAVFTTTVWTERKGDLVLYTVNLGVDPVIGTQRFYWSKSYNPGVAFSNGAHYVNPQVDALLEAAQVELDPAKRKAQYAEFQQIVMADLPVLPITNIFGANIVNVKVKDTTIDALGALGGFSRAWIDA